MDQFYFDESNGLWYELNGDYYIPCIALSESETDCDIGMWGRKHLNYLKENRYIRYTILMLNGKLGTYLTELNHQAKERFDLLIAQMAKAQGVNERLKARDQMAWVGAMNNIYSAATEIVDQELIFV